jgi:twitching motility two-component system response regulator PilH
MVVDQLKHSDLTRHIPIIFLTGSPEPNAQERAIELGARYYIKKPYDPEELLDAVKRALDPGNLGASE